jgi:hypothetical protein
VLKIHTFCNIAIRLQQARRIAYLNKPFTHHYLDYEFWQIIPELYSPMENFKLLRALMLASVGLRCIFVKKPHIQLPKRRRAKRVNRLMQTLHVKQRSWSGRKCWSDECEPTRAESILAFIG